MTTKRSISLILVIVMTLCLLAGCNPDPGINNPPSENEGPQHGGVLNLAWTGNGSDSLDPLYNTGWLTYIWATNVFETAISRDAEGNFVPCVCDFELSEDKMTLKLWVREGVTFHNGKPVTIEDVEYSLLVRPVGSTINIEKWFTNYVADYEIENGVMTCHFTEYNVNTLYYLSGYATFSAIIPKEIGEKYNDTENEEYKIKDIKDIIGTDFESIFDIE